MFEHETEGRERFAGELNGPQRNRLLTTCQHIDKLLNGVEQVLHEASSASPFRRHVIDIAPAQVRVLEDYIGRLRGQMLRALEWQRSGPPTPEIPATRAVLTNLAFMDIAIEELRPSYMRNSGEVPEDATDELNGVVHELRSLVEGMERYLRQEWTADLESRLRRLEETGCDVSLLRVLEETITRHGLVEFRSRVASLTGRLEDNHLEVALFGRVSSGKSSLLNALLETDVLPVGVNPITAVPTRLRYGAEPGVTVTYGDGHSDRVSVERLGELVTEQGNPGNLQNVVKAVVDVPSSRLQQGIVLVDTPGLGSLARKGAAETLAYLPACDLALLLIDAGNALNEEDVGTLRLLYEAGIPALVLLSKVDLLSETERDASLVYVAEQMRRELGVTIEAHPVSSLAVASDLLDQFFAEELRPRFEEAKGLREASLARKTGALRDAVMAALGTMLRRESESPAIDTARLETQVRVATGEVGELRATLGHGFLVLGESAVAVMDEVAMRAVDWYAEHPREEMAGQQLAEWIRDVVGERLHEELAKARATLQQAVETLRQVARELQHGEMPSMEELETAFRDLPRFELAAAPVVPGDARWRWFGIGALRAALNQSLRHNAGPALKEALRLYGYALREWSDHAVPKMELMVRSYADTYRAQIHRMNGKTDGARDRERVRSDFELLRDWRKEAVADVTAKQA